MKTNLTKTEARAKIDNFFKQDSFDKEQLRKTRRLAMKFNIKLGSYRKSFCKACKSQLKGNITVNKGYKTIECSSCKYKNRFRIS